MWETVWTWWLWCRQWRKLSHHKVDCTRCCGYEFSIELIVGLGWWCWMSVRCIISDDLRLDDNVALLVTLMQCVVNVLECSSNSYTTVSFCLYFEDLCLSRTYL